MIHPFMEASTQAGLQLHSNRCIGKRDRQEYCSALRLASTILSHQYLLEREGFKRGWHEDRQQQKLPHSRVFPGPIALIKGI